MIVRERIEANIGLRQAPAEYLIEDAGQILEATAPLLVNVDDYRTIRKREIIMLQVISS